MSKLDDLRRDRKAAATALSAAADAIDALEAAGTGPTAAEHIAAVAAFDAAQQSFKDLDARVARAETVEATMAAAAQGGDEGRPLAPNAPNASAGAPARPQNPAERGVEVGFVVHALARARGDRDKAAAFLDQEGHSGISAALSGATEAAGGVTIPRPMAEGLIALLRARVVVRAAGARTFPMPAGQIRQAKQIAPATATYQGENAAITPSAPSFDKLDQSFKKLTGLVPIGNSLLRHSGLAMAQLVRDDLVKVMALREDLAFIRGDGAANAPTGIRNWIAAGNWLAAANSGIAASATQADLALRKAISVVEDNNVALTNPGWIMRASTKNWLASLRDASGNLLFPSIDQNGQLKGAPIYITSQLPNNLGTAGDETEVYFGEFSEAMIGDSMDLNISMSTEAGYFDGSTFVSAYQNDLTLLRTISEHDFALEHDVAFSGFNAKGWSL